MTVLRDSHAVICSLATVLSCIDPSVRTVAKSPKVRPLLIFSISLVRIQPTCLAVVENFEHVAVPGPDLGTPVFHAVDEGRMLGEGGQLLLADHFGLEKDGLQLALHAQLHVVVRAGVLHVGEARVAHHDHGPVGKGHYLKEIQIKKDWFFILNFMSYASC